jgi:hypothetical protein
MKRLPLLIFLLAVPALGQSAPASPPAPSPSQQAGSNASAENRQPPRVFFQAASKGNNWNAHRDQSMEMAKDFEKNCPAVKITINQQMADYTVLLNHIEVGLSRDNQVQVADKNGDVLKTKEGGGIKGGMKGACSLILADWAKQAPPTPPAAAPVPAQKD